MGFLTKKNAVYTIGVILILLCTACIRKVWCSSNQLVIAIQGTAVFALYAGAVIGWGISVCSRVNHRQVKKHLLISVVLMLFWISARTTRFRIFENDYFWGNLCWYAYYIPMILLPLLSFLTATHLGEMEGWKANPKECWLYGIAGVLIIGILSNNLHQWAFIFLNGIEHPNEYRHGVLYFAVLIWSATLMLLMLWTLYRKCKVPGINKHIWLPLTFLIFGFFYTVLYIFDGAVGRTGFFDMTAMLCAIYIGFWESCIQTGLIPSSSKYPELFCASSLAV